MATQQPPSDAQGKQSSGHDGLVDPSILTTQQLLREMSGVRELYDARLNAINENEKLIRQVLETRIQGMDEAIKLVREETNLWPEKVKEKISALREIQDEKFDGIEKQFRERDTRTEQNAKDTKVAVDAALQAAEKAVGKQQESFALATNKSETATTKQIDQIADLLRQSIKVMDDKNNDQKERLVRVEGRGGLFAVAIASSILSVLISLAAIVVVMVKH